jgi:hypothetical protein
VSSEMNPWERINMLFRGAEHIHELRVVDCYIIRPREGVGAAFSAGIPAIPVTMALFRCDCGNGLGHLATQKIPGAWRLEQIQSGVPIYGHTSSGLHLREMDATP